MSAMRASVLVYRHTHTHTIKDTLTANTKYKLNTLNYAYNASTYYSDTTSISV